MNGRRLHFVGIGGAGMSGLALVAKTLGAEVSGSDRAESSYVERLRAAGIEPAIGHDAANLPEGAELVVSTAIADDNPELVRAHDEGRTVLHRADLLAELTHLKRTIAISGTHGKTTTTAMAVHALLRCGREPAYLVGGELRAVADQRRLGRRRVAGGGGRRVGPLVSQAGPGGHGGDQHGARPPRHLPLPAGAARGLRGVRRAGEDEDRLGPGGAGGRPDLRRGGGRPEGGGASSCCRWARASRSRGSPSGSAPPASTTC